MTKKPMTRGKAVQELTDLKRDIFPYLHRDYNEALDMAIESLERETLEEVPKPGV